MSVETVKLKSLFQCQTGCTVEIKSRCKFIIVDEFEFMVNQQGDKLMLEAYEGFEHKSLEHQDIVKITSSDGMILYDRYVINEQTSVDTPVFVWTVKDGLIVGKKKAHFCKYEEGTEYIYVFKDGKTSFTSNGGIDVERYIYGHVAEVIK